MWGRRVPWVATTPLRQRLRGVRVEASARPPARPAGGRSWTWTRLVLVTGETVQFDSCLALHLVLRTA
jgi:hypothetical protein